MKVSYVVKFFHRGGWHVFEEYGPTMEDAAILKALQLSGPFGNAELHKMSGDVLLELVHMKGGKVETRMEREQ